MEGPGEANSEVDDQKSAETDQTTESLATSKSSKGTLETILSQLINSPDPIEKAELESIREKLAKFPNLRLQTVKQLTQAIKNGPQAPVPEDDECQEPDKEQFMKNVLLVVEAICNAAISAEGETSAPAPESNPDDDSAEKKLPSKGLKKAGPSPELQEFKKCFSEAWTHVMRWEQKPLAVQKRIVTLLPDKIMPFLTKPLHMSDYLLSAFDLGGPMSLLALHGIFILMLRYNFEIPDFYTRLYSLFQPSIFQAKYKANFFASSSLFLSSTHLPEALVGGFVKRLARLALLAPTPSLPLIFDFIINLMLQHPGLKSLVNKETDEKSTMDSDPFLEDEPDPLKSRAMESCLWEIQSLQHHALASIAKRAKFIDKQLPKLERDLGESINYNYEELFKKEMGRRRKKSDQLNLEAMRQDLEQADTGTDFESIKCSKLKGRPCQLESEIVSILFPDKLS